MLRVKSSSACFLPWELHHSAWRQQGPQSLQGCPVSLQEQDRVRAVARPKTPGPTEPQMRMTCLSSPGRCVGQLFHLQALLVWLRPSRGFWVTLILYHPSKEKGGNRVIWETLILSLVSKGRVCGSSSHGFSSQCPLAWRPSSAKESLYRLGRLPNKKTNKTSL